MEIAVHELFNYFCSFHLHNWDLLKRAFAFGFRFMELAQSLFELVYRVHHITIVSYLIRYVNTDIITKLELCTFYTSIRLTLYFACGRMHFMCRSQLCFRTRLWVLEYCVSLNLQKASKAAGFVTTREYKKNPMVATAVETRLAILEVKSELRAEYVRQYIHDVLEFCPGDFFRPGVKGYWTIDPDAYEKLPQRARRLIEDVAMVEVNGFRYLQVKFISKTAALAMAAKFTLTQKMEMSRETLPWDEIARQLENSAADTIEQKLAKFDAERAQTNGVNHADQANSR